jgi:hypothetical protein
VAGSATTTPDPSGEFLQQIDSAALRHGYSDSELKTFAEELCSAAGEDHQSGQAAGSTDASSKIAGLWSPLAAEDRSSRSPTACSTQLQQAEASKIGLLAGSWFCPDCSAEISRDADISAQSP